MTKTNLTGKERGVPEQPVTLLEETREPTEHPRPGDILDHAYLLERRTAERNRLTNHLCQFYRLSHELEKSLERMEEAISKVGELDPLFGARLREVFTGAEVARSKASEVLTLVCNQIEGRRKKAP